MPPQRGTGVSPVYDPEGRSRLGRDHMAETAMPRTGSEHRASSPSHDALLVFHGALGDLVLCFPLALAVSRLGMRVRWVTQASKGRLAESLLGTPWTDIELGWHALYADAAQCPPSVEASIAGAELVVTNAAETGSTWMQNVRRLNPGASVVAIHSRPPESWALPHWRFLADQLPPQLAGQLALEVERLAARGLSPGHRPGPVLIHPGSGSARKNWPLARFASVARTLAAAGHPVRFLLGEVECESWPTRDVNALTSEFGTLRPRDYIELADGLRSARAFLGNDSGPGHLAGILGVATTILFGPSNPAVWRPLGPSVQCIHAPRLAELGADHVARAIMQGLATATT